MRGIADAASAALALPQVLIALAGYGLFLLAGRLWAPGCPLPVERDEPAAVARPRAETPAASRRFRPSPRRWHACELN